MNPPFGLVARAGFPWALVAAFALPLPGHAGIPGAEWRPIALRRNPVPYPRADHALVYDAAGDRFIVLGGRGALRYEPTRLLGDVWSIPGADPRWSPFRASGDALPPLWSRVAVVDPVGRRVVLFGGYDDHVESNEVWSVALGPPWTMRRETPSGAPPTPRFHTSAVYDPVRQRMLVFGGAGNGFSAFSNDVWALSLSGPLQWTQIAVSGIPPRSRAAHAAVYDPVRDRMLVFGGVDSSLQRRNDTWELTLGPLPTWRQLTTVGTPPESRGMDLVYDARRDRLLMFGEDFNPSPVVWALPLGPGGVWGQVNAACCFNPWYRTATRIAFDPVRDRLLVVGGRWDSTDSPYLNDVWALDLSGTPAWRELVRQDGSPTVEPYAGGTPVYEPGPERITMWAPAPFPFEAWTTTPTDSASWSPVRYALGAGHIATPGAAFHDPTFGRILAVGHGPGTATIVQALDLSAGRWDSLATFYEYEMIASPANTVFDRARSRILVYGGGCCPEVNAVWGIGLDPATGRATGFGRLPTDGLHPRPGNVLGTTIDGPRGRMLLLRQEPGADPELWALSMGAPPTWSRVTVGADPESGVPRFDALGPTVYDAPRDRWLVSPHWALLPGGSPRWDALGPYAETPPEPLWALEHDSIRDRLVAVDAGGGLWVWPSAPLPPPARTITFVSASADTARVRLEWFTNVPVGLSATVYRAGSGGPWLALAAATVAPSGVITCVDSAVTPGSRYTYRLAYLEGDEEVFAGEVTIDVPLPPGPGPSSPALAVGVRPHPAIGTLRVRVALPGGGSARLELLDSSGRLLSSQPIALGSGEHVVTVTPGFPLRNGIYFVRLQQGALTARSKAVLLR